MTYTRFESGPWPDRRARGSAAAQPDRSAVKKEKIMIRVMYLLLTMCLFCSIDIEANQKSLSEISFNVADSRELITKDIDKKLLLRVERYRSGLGWDVQVVRKPYDKNSSTNLLYHSLDWHGPYPSQVYAWHVAEKYFPNERELETLGYPYELKIILVNPVIEKVRTDVKFVSGTVRITWKRK